MTDMLMEVSMLVTFINSAALVVVAFACYSIIVRCGE
jgi:hypothetical protein